VTAALPAIIALAVAATTPAKFEFDRYPPMALAEAEKPADGTCDADATHRPMYTTDSALTPMRLRAQATQQFRSLPADSGRVIAQYEQSARSHLAPHYEEEVLVRIEGEPRWLAIQSSVAPFWREELRGGEEVWLYAVRIGCVQAANPTDDRAILSINEFQIEPIGQPEPHP
jgi:hypothetical protein